MSSPFTVVAGFKRVFGETSSDQFSAQLDLKALKKLGTDHVEVVLFPTEVLPEQIRSHMHSDGESPAFILVALPNKETQSKKRTRSTN